MTKKASMSDRFGPFREQLQAAVEAFAGGTAPREARVAGEQDREASRRSAIAATFQAMADDVARAAAEPLELFPVCHHSPSSGLHLRKRLGERPFKVIFLEAAEGLEASLNTGGEFGENLRECQFPIALQAFSVGSSAFPSAWTPLNVVYPLTEFSAEYQAIAYAMAHPETKLVFVDRAVDYIYQWMPKEDDALKERLADEPIDDGDPTTPDATEAPTVSHGTALGLQVGDLLPTFDEFHEFLLKNARVKHFSEWWDQYVESATLTADYATYRQVMFLIGSMLRRFGRRDEDIAQDRQRERYMWTKMKGFLAEHGIHPEDAIHVCGAAHTASDVEEFGVASPVLWEVPPRTETTWLYGVIPSSHLAIEHQFRHPPGSLRLAEKLWKKALTAHNLKPFTIEKRPKSDEKKRVARAAGGAAKSAADTAESAIFDYLATAPAPLGTDDDELVRWCIEITTLARNNGYLTSTADAIAIFQTSKLLAGVRNRAFPTPYDFTDAAITCLEKDRTPKKRDIRRLCQIMLGGDRIGQVGYASLPPLAQDVYDRLKPLEGRGFTLENKRTQRALLDFKAAPELHACSQVLWMLHYLNRSTCVPIMGERTLGSTPVQESWEVYFTRTQTPIIQLGYEGISLEHVIEKRLKAAAFASSATTVAALSAVEDAILYLRSPRLVAELGEHAIVLLEASTSAAEAPQVFERIRRLVHYYRAQPTGLPAWIKRFVTTGYSHYATLLPASIQDEMTAATDVAAMLSFLFTLESLALAFGAQRSQLLIAVKQAGGAEDLAPTKVALLWSAEWLLGLRKIEDIRAFLDAVLDNPMMLPAFPDYVAGFLLALGFTPLVARVVVELLSKAFARPPDDVLLPWPPSLIMALRPLAGDLVPTLLKEVSVVFPASLAALDGWSPPWDAAPVPVAPPVETKRAVAEVSQETQLLRAFLAANGAVSEAVAALLGCPAVASPRESRGPETDARPPEASKGALAELLQRYPATLEAVASGNA